MAIDSSSARDTSIGTTKSDCAALEEARSRVAELSAELQSTSAALAASDAELAKLAREKEARGGSTL